MLDVEENSLLIKCLHSTALKRQMIILRQFEENKPTSGDHLAIVCGYSRRTIVSDIESIRDYFHQEISIHATSNGYELTIINFASYQKRKKSLLLKDANLLFLHLLCQQAPNIKEFWMKTTGFGSQTFKKQRRYLEKVLGDYDLSFSEKPWRMIGSEESLHCFYHAFYFGEDEQPYHFYDELDNGMEIYCPSLFDTSRAKQWFLVFILREVQGGKLTEKPVFSDFCRRFKEHTEFTITLFGYRISISDQEYCLLYLLMMDEEELLSFLLKNDWLEKRFPFKISDVVEEITSNYELKITDEQLFSRLTLVCMLLDRLFQIPITSRISQRDKSAVVENNLLYREGLSTKAIDYLITLGKVEIKNQLVRCLGIHYYWKVPRKVNQWIQDELNGWLNRQGIQVISEKNQTFEEANIKQVIVTDQQWVQTFAQPPVYRLGRNVSEQAIQQLGIRIVKDLEKSM
ncbi:helix-turn-helix domain-containing protein [Enterococcus casseliflavus]|uniref:helix-turn-helix domain-containing protein n=1 Tax=Enterococcus casseliflavus TaxID=37734 RepID=UPI00201CFB00|nr:helix-turn-helix domain-containing protein [Enterococcus casseliflavus]UQZ97948.1 HTH domain-containing protein [Enterococcus casseliflavus]